MTPLTSALLGAAMMAVLVLLSWLLRPWRILSWASERREQRREISDALSVLNLSADATKEAELAALKIQGELAQARRRGDEMFAKVEEVLRERDEWKSLYYQQATQHGAAQDLLMREREANATRLVSLGQKPFVDPSVARVVRAFREEHIDPAVAAEAVERVSGKKRG